MNSAILNSAQESSLFNLIGLGTSSFSLCWRGSRDGFAASTFHSLCNNKGSTLTVVKATTGYIMGGYAALPWTSVGNYVIDSSAKSFLFSLVNAQNTPIKMPLSIYPQYGLYDSSSVGPTFGGGHDLYIPDNSNTGTSSMNTHSYQYPTGVSSTTLLGGTNSFQVSDIEVYAVDSWDSTILELTTQKNDLRNLIGKFIIFFD